MTWVFFFFAALAVMALSLVLSALGEDAPRIETVKRKMDFTV